MRPVEPKKLPIAPRRSDAVTDAPPPLPIPAEPLSHNPPRPIGPEALKRLREAIQSGRYPDDTAVRAGLERMIRRAE